MTPDQRAATDALESAIAGYMIAFDSADARGILTDWVLVTAEHADDHNGPSTTYGRWMPDEQPAHRTLGLLDYQTARLRSYIAGLE